MQGTKLTIIGLISVAGLLLSGSVAFGYKLCGYNWTYMDNPMGEDYLVNPNCRDLNGEELDAVKAAAHEWNTTGGANFTFSYGGKCDATDCSYNDKNEIMWVDYNTGAVATAHIWHGIGRYRKRIYECDMVFNDKTYTWSIGGSGNVMDVQNVATHELGHFLCLGDLYGAEDADKTMYGYVSYGETKKRTLHGDDIAGIQAIYGAPPPPPGIMHVASIDTCLKQKGPWTNAIAKVTIVDKDGAGVPQATVEGHWEGLTTDTDVFETGSDGVGECSSDKLKNPSGCFIFWVDWVSKEEWTYDPKANADTSDTICVGGGGGQSAGTGPAEPMSIGLSQNRPEPFSRSTVISYQLPVAGWVTLSIYDLTGRLVATLADEAKGAGYHTAEWKAQDASGQHMPSGIYFSRLSAGGRSSIKKLTLLR